MSNTKFKLIWPTLIALSIISIAVLSRRMDIKTVETDTNCLLELNALQTRTEKVFDYILEANRPNQNIDLREREQLLIEIEQIVDECFEIERNMISKNCGQVQLEGAQKMIHILDVNAKSFVKHQRGIFGFKD